MSNIAIIVFDGRLTKDPETIAYGNEGKTLTRFSVASSQGTREKPTTLFFNCTCFGKYGETIAKYFNQGDQIIITGTPTQRKDENGKVYHGVNVTQWGFGSKKGSGQGKPSDSHETDSDFNGSDSNPFNDDDIPF